MKEISDAVFDFVAQYNKPPQYVSDEELREYFSYETNV